MSIASGRTDLVRVETADGLLLDGALSLAAAGTLSIDAFLLVHGTGGNFYAPGVLEEFAAHARAAGVTTLRINTRGHDGISSIPSRGGGVKGGATYETVAECRHDLAAWIGLLVDRGLRRIALVGHSMGGVKAIYTMAHDSHPEVRALIALSPPRFSFANFQQHPLGTGFRADYERAVRWVAEGRADELMSVTQPLPFLATAGGFVEKYGPEDRYDLLRFLPNISVPSLLFVGSNSMQTSPAFFGLPDAVRNACGPGAPITVRVIEGAGINYGGCIAAVFAEVSAWLQNERSLAR